MPSSNQPTHERTRLEAAFASALGPMRQHLRRAFDHELTAFGLSRALASPFLIIWQNDGIRQRELAERLDIEGPSLVRLLDQLGANGLVVRRPDPNDQRAKTLHLTSAGKALARRISPVIDRLRASLLADASDQEIETCVRVFSRFLTACGRSRTDVPK